MELTNTDVLPGAEGEAEFAIHGPNTEFEVKVEDLPAGLYPLIVGGDEKGQIEVVDDGGKLKGKLKFTDPVKEGSLELDFNPRGAIIEVLQGSDVILESLFPDE